MGLKSQSETHMRLYQHGFLYAFALDLFLIGMDLTQCSCKRVPSNREQ